MSVRLLSLSLVAGLALAGCYESADPALHEPGVYKGPSDPLLEKQKSPEHQEALSKRFSLVQTDR